MNRFLYLPFLFGLLLLTSCSSDDKTEPKTDVSATPDDDGACIQSLGEAVSGSVGSAMVFTVDPRISSGNNNLQPSSSLNGYRSSVVLNRLSGQGVLLGEYADVRDGLSCDGFYRAFDSSQKFNFEYSDGRFQEAMTYHYADRYRYFLAQAGYLYPAGSLQLIAHCMEDDNAFFVRYTDGSGVVQVVCLGDSVYAPGSSYADDAQVTIHEAQHATTINAYSSSISLNQYWYDEAGSLNEGVSDFMALMNTAPLIADALDPKRFSRWALGSFFPSSGERGAHRCPQYDAQFPSCGGYNADPTLGFSPTKISYAYPDGLGWPYANNFAGPGYIKNAYTSYSAQEEIHNNATIISGAFYDLYLALKNVVGRSEPVAAQMTAQVVIEGIKHLAKPTAAALSPVTMRGLAAEVVNAAGLLGWGPSDLSIVNQVLTERGLVGGNLLSSGWGAVGAGVAATPGVKIKDNPTTLQNWIASFGGDPNMVTQTTATGLNNRLDPGEVALVWFDIQNNSATTAGGVNLKVTSPDIDITFLDSSINVGAISSSEAQVQYGKINGTSIVSALSSGNPSLHVPTGNSYFKTNTFYSNQFYTGVWIKVSNSAAHGKVVNLSVEATPSNGASSTVGFAVTIQ